MAKEESNLPAAHEVVQTINVAPSAAPGGVAVPAFQILRTLELDPYENKATAPATLAEAVAAVAAATDDFGGTDRRDAKLSIVDAPTEDFDDLAALLDSLPADSKMAKHKPKITRAPTQDRVAEEERNVSAPVWLYAASRESDNDFHTILGTDPAETPRRFMNAEVSGLPPDGSASLQTLRDVRASFLQIVQNAPLAGYDFYKPPIPVTVTGSLFFDVTHANSPDKPGPAKAKPKTVWEIHPLTSMEPREV